MIKREHRVRRMWAGRYRIGDFQIVLSGYIQGLRAWSLILGHSMGPGESTEIYRFTTKREAVAEARTLIDMGVRSDNADDYADWMSWCERKIGM